MSMNDINQQTLAKIRSKSLLQRHILFYEFGFIDQKEFDVLINQLFNQKSEEPSKQGLMRTRGVFRHRHTSKIERFAKMVNS